MAKEGCDIANSTSNRFAISAVEFKRMARPRGAPRIAQAPVPGPARTKDESGLLSSFKDFTEKFAGPLILGRSASLS